MCHFKMFFLPEKRQLNYFKIRSENRFSDTRLVLLWSTNIFRSRCVIFEHYTYKIFLSPVCEKYNSDGSRKLVQSREDHYIEIVWVMKIFQTNILFWLLYFLQRLDKKRCKFFSCVIFWFFGIKHYTIWSTLR